MIKRVNPKSPKRDYHIKNYRQYQKPTKRAPSWIILKRRSYNQKP